MKKQMTEHEVEDFLISSEHLASSSISGANLKGAKKRTFWISMETAKIHHATWGTTKEGMAPQKY